MTRMKTIALIDTRLEVPGAIVSHWQSASDEDWALARAREAVIRLLTDQPEVTAELVVTASDELGISRSLA
jgi:hypothetical protein